MSHAAITSQERRALVKDRARLLLLVGFLLLCVVALANGAMHRSALSRSTQAFVTEKQEALDKWQTRAQAVESGKVKPEDDAWAGLAMDVKLPVSAQPGPLADLSVGVSDHQPTTAEASQWRTVDRLFGNYEYQSPAVLAQGPFDLAFVVIFVLPLVMIVMAFDVLSEDRERGRLGLILAQPVAVGTVVFSRLRVRLGALLGVLVVALVCGLVVGAGGIDVSARIPRFLLWSALACVHFGLWAAIIAWVVSWRRTGEATLLVLVATWALTCLIGPACISAATEAVYPTPSRLQLLSQVRQASSEAYQSRADIVQGMTLDHPELEADQYSLPEFIRTAYIVTQTVDGGVAAPLATFEQVQADRQRFLGFAQYLSPAVLTLQAFNETAGTSLARQRAFERQARQFKRDLAQRIEQHVLTGRRMTVAELDALPRFSFEEASLEQVLGRAAVPLGFLALLAAVFATLAARNLARAGARIDAS